MMGLEYRRLIREPGVGVRKNRVGVKVQRVGVRVHRVGVKVHLSTRGRVRVLRHGLEYHVIWNKYLRKGLLYLWIRGKWPPAATV